MGPGSTPPPAPTASPAAMWAEQEVEPPSNRRRTFPASDLRRPPKRTRHRKAAATPVRSTGDLVAEAKKQDGAGREAAGLGHQAMKIALPVEDLKTAVDAEMRLYRRELRVDTPTMMKISALDLMSKEFPASSFSSLSAVADGRVPRARLLDVDHALASGWSRDARRPTATVRNSTRAAPSTQQEDDLLLAPAPADSFRSAIRLPTLIGQCFAVLPTSTAPTIVPRFRALSLRMLYWAVVTSGLFLNVVLTIVEAVTVKPEDNSITASTRWIFYLSAVGVSVLYLRLAMRWRTLCLCFLRVEHRMWNFGHPPHLQRRLRIITVVVLSLALVEYALALASGITSQAKVDTFHQFLVDYFRGNYPHMLRLTSYNVFVLVMEQLLNTTATFMWNYNDLFIMLISVSIAQRFKLLNTRLYECPTKEKTQEFWKNAREVYNALSLLTRDVDKILGVQILFSFMNNLYYICIQLLHTVKYSDHSTLKNIYFVFSFGLLILRTASVSLFAASINDESKIVKKFLYSVSSNTYCEEVDRFIIQATSDEIALTGFKFFSITRSVLLTVVGTVATYEIVLVQFNGNKEP